MLVLTAKDLEPDEVERLRGGRVRRLLRKGDLDRGELLAGVAGLLDARPCVLVVEDRPDNLATVKALLGGRYRLREASDGEAALQAAAEVRPDLILLDMGLPKLDGYQVVAALKRDPALRQVPVIAVTAEAMEGDRARILAAGCQDCVAKPIEPATFEAKIRHWLGEAGPGRG